MVRTYAFNPSTQNSVTLPGGPQHVNRNDSHAPYSTFEAIHQNNAAFTQLKDKPLDNSLSGYSVFSNSNQQMDYTNPLNQNSMKKALELIPSDTQLIGIRSVVINGQQFYQPIDPQLSQLITNQFAALGMGAGNKGAIQKSSSQSVPLFGNSQNDVALAMMQMANGHNANYAHPLPMATSTYPNPPEKMLSKSYPFENQKQDAPVMHTDLPWARGNPQPRSGKRGTAAWNVGQGLAPVPSIESIYQDSDVNSLSSAPPAPIPTFNFSTSNSYGSFYNDPTVAARNTYVPSATTTRYVNPYDPDELKRLEKHQHKLDLLRQIEENRQRKEIEKLQERQLEEREIWRSKIAAQRQLAEMEAEKRVAREKAIMAEKKATKVSLMNARNASTSSSHDGGLSAEMSGPARKYEWWERKKAYDDIRGSSPVIPALRSRPTDGSNSGYQSRSGSSQAKRRSASLASRGSRQSNANNNYSSAHQELNREQTKTKDVSNSESENLE